MEQKQEEEKPKRKRRTRAEIEAEKAALIEAEKEALKVEPKGVQAAEKEQEEEKKPVEVSVSDDGDEQPEEILSNPVVVPLASEAETPPEPGALGNPPALMVHPDSKITPKGVLKMANELSRKYNQQRRKEPSVVKVGGMTIRNN